MEPLTLFQIAPDGPIESGSPFCIKVQRALTYKKVDYRTVNVNPARLRSVNPETGKVPVLDFGGESIHDSTRILDRLEAFRPEPRLVPEDPRSAAWSHLLEDWADESLTFLTAYFRWKVDPHYAEFSRSAFSRMGAPMRFVFPPLVRTMTAFRLDQQGLGRLEPDRVKQILDAHLDALQELVVPDGFLLGGRPFRGDIAVFSVLRILVQPYMTEVRDRLISRRRLYEWLGRVDELTRPAKAEPLPAR
ncbi:MAG: glutathione S-transferase family protein [Myxococcota bacterium]